MSDESNPLDHELLALLSEVAGPVAPPAGAKHRVAGRLSAVLGIPLVDGIDLGFGDARDATDVDVGSPEPGSLDVGSPEPIGLDPGSVDASALDPGSIDVSALDVSGGDASVLDVGGFGLDHLAAHGHVAEHVQQVVEGGAALATGIAGVGKAAGAALGAASAASATSAAGAGSLATVSAATASATSAAGAGLVAAVVKPIVIGSFVVGAVLGGGTALVVKEKPAVVDVEKPRVVYVPAPPRTAPLPAETQAVTRATDDDGAPAALEAPRARAKAALRASRPEPAKAELHEVRASPDLAAELEMLEGARAALTRGAHRDALKALDAHRDAFGQSPLAEEREAMTVLALVALGQEAEALAASRAFKKAYPRSAQWPVIEAALGASGVAHPE